MNGGLKMLTLIIKIIVGIFAAIGICVVFLYLNTYFLRSTNKRGKKVKNFVRKSQIKIWLNNDDPDYTEYILRSLLADSRKGLLKNSEIVIVDDGLGNENKRICQIFSSSMHGISIQKTEENI